MNGTTALLVAILLTLSVRSFVLLSPISVSSPLEPLEESQVQVRWMSEGEPAPFDGLLMNNYTYQRLRLKLGE